MNMREHPDIHYDERGKEVTSNFISSFLEISYFLALFIFLDNSLAVEDLLDCMLFRTPFVVRIAPEL